MDARNEKAEPFPGDPAHPQKSYLEGWAPDDYLWRYMECTKFAPLLNATVESGFKPREGSADSAYISYDNMGLVASHGGDGQRGVVQGALSQRLLPDPEHRRAWNRGKVLREG